MVQVSEETDVPAVGERHPLADRGRWYKHHTAGGDRFVCTVCAGPRPGSYGGPHDAIEHAELLHDYNDVEGVGVPDGWTLDEEFATLTYDKNGVRIE